MSDFFGLTVKNRSYTEIRVMLRNSDWTQSEKVRGSDLLDFCR